MSKSTGKGKLIGSIILLVLSLAALGFAIFCFAYVGKYEGKEHTNLISNGIIFMVATIVLMAISNFLIKRYREESGNKGVATMVLYGFTFIAVICGGFVLLVVYGIIKIFKSISSGSGSSSTKQTYKIKDPNGIEHTLKKDSALYGSYKDSNGKYWDRYYDESGEMWLSTDGKEFHKKG